MKGLFAIACGVFLAHSVDTFARDLAPPEVKPSGFKCKGGLYLFQFPFITPDNKVETVWAPAGTGTDGRVTHAHRFPLRHEDWSYKAETKQWSSRFRVPLSLNESSDPQIIAACHEVGKSCTFSLAVVKDGAEQEPLPMTCHEVSNLTPTAQRATLILSGKHDLKTPSWLIDFAGRLAWVGERIVLEDSANALRLLTFNVMEPEIFGQKGARQYFTGKLVIDLEEIDRIVGSTTHGGYAMTRLFGNADDNGYAGEYFLESNHSQMAGKFALVLKK